MKTPTSSAPHICWNVRRKISPSCAALSLPMIINSIAMMIHEARMALPPMYGVKLNVAFTSGLAGSHTVASDEHATALTLYQLIFGSGDHGPVHAATTTNNTMNGSHACATSAAFRPWP